MRAVNLIPRDERRGGASGGSRSPYGAYALLGGLSMLLVLVVVYVFSANTVHDRRAELAQLQVDNAAAQAQAAKLKPYGDFAALRKERVGAVRAIATSRFNWARAVRELSVAMPNDVTLSALDATTASSGAGTASGAGMKLTGCTKGQRAVAGMMASLRQVAGVDRVELASADNSAGEGCKTQFSVNVLFRPTAVPAAAVTTPSPQGATP